MLTRAGLFTTLSVECPENLDWGLFTEQTCYILSEKSWCLKCPDEDALEALRGAQ